jgi:hypothetical protein
MKEIKPRQKPVIPTAPAPSPEDLERSYQDAMRRMSGENEFETTPLVVEIAAEKPARTTTKPVQKAATKPATKQKTSTKITKKQAEEESSSNRPGKHRLTIDLPDDLFALVEAHKTENGQSFTWLVGKLLKDFFLQK